MKPNKMCDLVNDMKGRGLLGKPPAEDHAMTGKRARLALTLSKLKKK